MTNPGGESSETPASDPSSGSSEPTSGGYEAPSIEQSQQHDEQPEPQPAPEQLIPPAAPAEQYFPPSAPTEQYTPPSAPTAPAAPPRAVHPARIRPAVDWIRRAAELSTARGLSAGRLSATRLPARAGLS